MSFVSATSERSQSDELDASVTDATLSDCRVDGCAPILRDLRRSSLFKYNDSFAIRASMVLGDCIACVPLKMLLSASNL